MHGNSICNISNNGHLATVSSAGIQAFLEKVFEEKKNQNDTYIGLVTKFCSGGSDSRVLNVSIQKWHFDLTVY